MGYIFNQSLDYSNFGQSLQNSLASSTMYILITIALVLFIGAVMIGGFKQVASKHRLKWLLLHTFSLFIIAYLLKDFTMNKYLEIFVFSIGITLLSATYRYLMNKSKFEIRLIGIWFIINGLSFLVILILFETIGVTEPLLKLFFSSFCLTFMGSIIHSDFKN